MGGRGDRAGSAWRIGGRPWTGLLVVMVLALVLTLTAAPAFAFSLPGRRPAATPASGSLDTGRFGLQEVAPPLAVQQLRQALDGRRPRLEILAPADGALLPAGPWTLRLRVEDWPLVDAGPLGLGPHLVVQLDGDPPLPLTTTSITMRPLEPGTHRLTVYAARPWGEVVKSPGAQCQIRLHRVVANPLSQPAPRSPQLIAVSPRGEMAATPLLLDWLLLDAPLQNLRAGDASWRLRVSVNGDSVLLDQQSPLWLEGWRNGDNAIQLELLDGLGEPLNPPFNSLVGEVSLVPGGERPRWQGGRLEPAELASLLGEAPPPTAPVPEPEPDQVPEPEPGPEAALEPEPETASEPEQATAPEPEARSEPLSDAAGAADVGPAPAPPPSPDPENPSEPGAVLIAPEGADDPGEDDPGEREAPPAPLTASASPADGQRPDQGPDGSVPQDPEPPAAEEDAPAGDDPPGGRLQRLQRLRLRSAP